MLETYSVYTALATEKSPVRKTVTLKAKSFFEAATNAAHYLGWATTNGMVLLNREQPDLREYRMGAVTFDVVRKVAA